MDRITVKAYAKLNLTLSVLYLRADGYHALDSLMQGIDLYDTVTVEKAPDVLVTATGMHLPYENAMRRAAEKYRANTGRGAHIRAELRVPGEAGLGGGSADAAAVLYGMQALYDELDGEQLSEIALSIGADVPFCLHVLQGGSLARAEGVGELLTPLSGMPMTFLLLKPKEGVSTKELFSALPLPRKNPDLSAALRAIGQRDAAALGGCLGNALEEPAIRRVPAIGKLKMALLDAGALGAVMTGSGSTVFGLFAQEAVAEAAREKLSGLADFCRVCRSLPPQNNRG